MRRETSCVELFTRTIELEGLNRISYVCAFSLTNMVCMQMVWRAPKTWISVNTRLGLLEEE